MTLLAFKQGHSQKINIFLLVFGYVFWWYEILKILIYRVFTPKSNEKITTYCGYDTGELLSMEGR
jgi:hypothetical protein